VKKAVILLIIDIYSNFPRLRLCCEPRARCGFAQAPSQSNQCGVNMISSHAFLAHASLFLGQLLIGCKDFPDAFYRTLNKANTP
jgi:hypothetical protein